MRWLHSLSLAILAALLAPAAHALGTGEFAPPEEAFVLEATVTGEGVRLEWTIADGYYMYRERFEVRALTPAATVGEMVMPPGKIKEDETFGTVEVYRHRVPIEVALGPAPGGAPLVLAVTGQGCADLGLCYPPFTRTVSITAGAAMVAPVGAPETPARAARLQLLAQALGVPAGGSSAGARAPAGALASPAPLQSMSPPPSAVAAASVPVADSDPLAALRALGGERAAPPATSAVSAAPAGESSVSALAAFGRSLGQTLGLGTEPEFLHPDQAFQLSAEVVGTNTLRARWTIADGYYLYRDKFRFQLTDAAGVELGEARMRPGKLKRDAYFGDVEVYYEEAVAELALARSPGPGGPLGVRITYQGCADAGLCYPPIDRDVSLLVPASLAPSPPQALAAGAMTLGGAAPGGGAVAAPISEQDQLTGVLLSGNLGLILAAFFVGGALLSLTPCVFPMIPILSSILVGEGEACSRRRAFMLSFVYVQGMAITYTVAGIAAGLTGANVQVAFQDPAVLTVFALVFVALALSMFGFYDLQVPAAVQARMARFSNRQRTGRYGGVAVMGVLSALIVGPCVAPPLIGALGYIGQTGDPVLGGMALYVLSLGMGVPLLLLGLSAGHIMPRAGPWMDAVKAVFGVLLLAVALFFMDRVLPGWVTMLLWAALFICAAIYMGALDQVAAGVNGWRRLWKGSGLVLMVYGVLLMVGAAGGNTDPLQPLKGLAVPGGAPGHEGLRFAPVKGLGGVQAALREAGAQGRPVMLDYYADWCISCKEMEKFTFSDPQVRAALAGALLLQTDVTANDAEDQALLRAFGLLGPPTIQFFTPDGGERRAFRVVGFMDAERFRAHVRGALGI